MSKPRTHQRGARHARQAARPRHPTPRTRVIILGAGGRDFHDFNEYFRQRPDQQVVAFTATQIPDLEGRQYPPALAGPLYPGGIPIYSEDDLPDLIRRLRVELVVFAYSDVSHEQLMHVGSTALAAGASFLLLGPGATSLTARVPVISICAVRTGAGKSQTTRRVTGILKVLGQRIAVIRHPMAYGDLARQRVQRFAVLADLDRYQVTIEEREEYEPHISAGTVVYAGVDYRAVVRQAQREADIIVWDGGNNDFPFVRSNLQIVLADPHRAGHELTYHPGETNLRMADVVVINKVDTAPPAGVAQVRANIARVNPRATVIEAASPVHVDDPTLLRGRRALVVEDGPTLTHGGMTFGAGIIAARKYGVAELVDPRPHAVGSIQDVFRRYTHLGPVLPAMGYGAQQIRELEETIAATDCDVVVIGTPVDLRRVISIRTPAVRVGYELEELTTPNLDDVIRKWHSTLS
jgi:predicted GTPase